jgi:hypothetical protein
MLQSRQQFNKSVDVYVSNLSSRVTSFTPTDDLLQWRRLANGSWRFGVTNRLAQLRSRVARRGIAPFSPVLHAFESQKAAAVTVSIHQVFDVDL